MNGKTVTYTYQSGGKYTELDTPVNLIENGTLSVNTTAVSGMQLCSGNLPYGTTVVTVTNNDTTYSVTLKKRRVLTNVAISSDENSDSSLVTDQRLVVISSANPSINMITYKAGKNDYEVSSITGTDNPMSFRCFVDSEATVNWTVKQTKTFTAQTTTSEKTVTDYDRKNNDSHGTDRERTRNSGRN